MIYFFIFRCLKLLRGVFSRSNSEVECDIKVVSLRVCDIVKKNVSLQLTNHKH